MLDITEVPGLNSGKLYFSQYFVHLFYPAVTTLLDYLDHMILHLCLVFAL